MADPYIDRTGSTKLPDGRWKHVFSQSFLSNYQKCPEQARSIYMREVKSEPTDSTALGTACHEGWEYALHEKKAGETPSLDEMIDVTHNCLDTIGSWKYTKFSRERVYAMVPLLMEGWLEEIFPKVEPYEMEKRFNVLLYSGKHREVYLTGTIDCIADDATLWDWKTASQPYEKWEKQRWAIQPTVYTYAHQQQLADECLRTGYEGWIPNAGEMDADEFTYGITLHDGSTQIVTVERDQSHLDWLKQMASQVAWMIEHGVKPWPFNDSGWWCGPKWCPKFKDCKGLHIQESWAA